MKPPQLQRQNPRSIWVRKFPAKSYCSNPFYFWGLVACGSTSIMVPNNLGEGIQCCVKAEVIRVWTKKSPDQVMRRSKDVFFFLTNLESGGFKIQDFLRLLVERCFELFLIFNQTQDVDWTIRALPSRYVLKEEQLGPSGFVLAMDLLSKIICSCLTRLPWRFFGFSLCSFQRLEEKPIGQGAPALVLHHLFQQDRWQNLDEYWYYDRLPAKASQGQIIRWSKKLLPHTQPAWSLLRLEVFWDCLSRKREDSQLDRGEEPLFGGEKCRFFFAGGHLPTKTHPVFHSDRAWTGARRRWITNKQNNSYGIQSEIWTWQCLISISIN